MATLPLHDQKDNTLEKTCAGPCGRTLPATVEYWHKKKSGKYGLRANCKICTKTISKQYHSNTEVKKRRKEYYARQEIKQHVQEYVKQYHKEYHTRPEVKERDRIHSRIRYARKKFVLGTHTSEQIQDQLKRQKHHCYYCQKRLQKTKGKYIYHIDHTYPLSRVAGTDIPANSIDYLVLACPTCNTSKGDKFPWEWLSGGRLL